MKLTKRIKQELAKDGYRLRQYQELQNNKEAVLIAVKSNGEALGFASKRLRANKAVVIEAVKQKSYALYYASKRLQKLLTTNKN